MVALRRPASLEKRKRRVLRFCHYSALAGLRREAPVGRRWQRQVEPGESDVAVHVTHAIATRGVIDHGQTFALLDACPGMAVSRDPSGRKVKARVGKPADAREVTGQGHALVVLLGQEPEEAV